MNIYEEYDKNYLRFETEFVGSYLMNIFYLEQDSEMKEKLRQEIQRRRELAKELFKPQ